MNDPKAENEHKSENEHMPLVQDDAWLLPVSKDIKERYNRFLNRLDEINTKFGSLTEFADAYTYFGINYSADDAGWYYREWAPQAYGLYLTGDFNDWNRESHPLKPVGNGIWEIFLDEVTYMDSFTNGSKVKVFVDAANGFNARIPAYIRRVVQDEGTANFSGQVWWDFYDWSHDDYELPSADNLLIYEAHVGMAHEGYHVGSYKEFTINVLPRINELGYNAIQLMAVQEHPYYGSFGYHVSNFFAPSSRFGTPEELKSLIDTAHSMGLAVILDIVHSHTVKNIHEGLNLFDGSDSQYFHPAPRGVHPDWDSLLFDYGKIEVLQFLLSNVKYWIEEFHFDGFRFDGVGSMMYFHHGNEVIDTQAKYFTQGVEWDAVTYLQLANQLARSLSRKTVTIAEDVTGMPGLTFPVEDGGIGFDFRLGMGIPDYWIKLIKHEKDEDWNIYEMWHVLTNRLPGVNTVAYAESHDQALVGDQTLAFRLMGEGMYYHMHRDDDNYVIARGMALHKMIRLFTISTGGTAYLNFMGNEFGHPEWIDFPREGNQWSYHYARRQWSLVDDPGLKYGLLNNFDREMIHLISTGRCFEEEYPYQLHMDEGNQLMVFRRGDYLFIFNFHPHRSLVNYRIPIPTGGSYRIMLNTDNRSFGGFDRIDEVMAYASQPQEAGEESKAHYLSMYLPSRTALMLKQIG